jgi:D-alanine transaminase
VLRQVIARNRIGYGIVCPQVTRGVARRGHAFPAPELMPSLLVTVRPVNEALAASGVAVIGLPDNRWGRVDIRTSGLRPNVLARQAAINRGERDAWFVDKDGVATEGASANALDHDADRHGGHASGGSWYPERHYPHRAVRGHQAAGG